MLSDDVVLGGNVEFFMCCYGILNVLFVEGGLLVDLVVCW